MSAADGDEVPWLDDREQAAWRSYLDLRDELARKAGLASWAEQLAESAQLELVPEAGFTLDAYRSVLSNDNLITWFVNSTVVTLVVTVLPDFPQLNTRYDDDENVLYRSGAVLGPGPLVGMVDDRPPWR